MEDPDIAPIKQRLQYRKMNTIINIYVLVCWAPGREIILVAFKNDSCETFNMLTRY